MEKNIGDIIYKIGDIIEFYFIDEDGEEFRGIGTLGIINVNYPKMDFTLSDIKFITNNGHSYKGISIKKSDIIKYYISKNSSVKGLQPFKTLIEAKDSFLKMNNIFKEDHIINSLGEKQDI